MLNNDTHPKSPLTMRAISKCAKPLFDNCEDHERCVEVQSHSDQLDSHSLLTPTTGRNRSATRDIVTNVPSSSRNVVPLQLRLRLL